MACNCCNGGKCSLNKIKVDGVDVPLTVKSIDITGILFCENPETHICGIVYPEDIIRDE